MLCQNITLFNNWSTEFWLVWTSPTEPPPQFKQPDALPPCNRKVSLLPAIKQVKEMDGRPGLSQAFCLESVRQCWLFWQSVLLAVSLWIQKVRRQLGWIKPYESWHKATYQPKLCPSTVLFVWLVWLLEVLVR